MNITSETIEYFVGGLLLGALLTYLWLRPRWHRHDSLSPIQSALADHYQKITELEGKRAVEQQDFRTLMDLLRVETGQLGRALRQPQVRGAWGEVVLDKVLELSGLIKGQHYVTQQTMNETQLRPDVIVHLPNNLSVVIDAKVPLAAWLEAQDENRSDADRQLAVARHSQQLKQHIQALGQKDYWAQVSEMSPEFVVLFVPDEGMLSAALRQDPALFELASKMRIVLASPLNLIGLLRTVSYGWRQDDIKESTRQIAELGRKLYASVAKFADYYETMGKRLDSVVEAYNQSIGSLEKTFLPTARKFKELNVVDTFTKSIPIMSAGDKAVRHFNAPELVLPESDSDDSTL